MIRYFSGSLPKNPETRQKFFDLNTGVLITPACSYFSEDLSQTVVAADNGCFQKSWDPGRWRDWISCIDREVEFAVVPDVVGDWHATRSAWDQYLVEVTRRCFTPAFVLQDGQRSVDVPWDQAGYLFIGGSTEFKLSDAARRLTSEACERGLGVHMGRVNSYKRLQLASDWGCISADGTFLGFGPDQNISRLEAWFRKLH